METQLNISLKGIVITVVVVVLLFGGGFGWIGNQLNNTKQELLDQKNLTEAFQDTVRYTRNKNNEVTAEKKTMQASLKTLGDKNLNLSKDKIELINEVRRVNKVNTIISAAYVKMQASLDSITYGGDVFIDDTKKTLTFTEVNDSISFDITINNAIAAFYETKPTITFNTFKLLNTQDINFHWNDNKEYEQKPVSFSITNSNPLFTVTNIESYVIPEVNKSALKPTGMQKVGRFFKNRKTDLIIGVIATSIGIYVGATNF